MADFLNLQKKTMAENKKSFVLYADQIHQFEGLEDDEAGRLIKHIFRYVNDLNPTAPDRITQVSFEPIKQQLKRDLVKYEIKRQQWSEAGKASAEAKKLAKEQTQHTSTSVDSVQRPSTVSTVNGTVNVNVIQNTASEETFEKFWNYYKKGSKKAAREKFIKLSDVELEQIKVHLPAYFKANPEVKFRKDAERYLSNRLWENGDIAELTKKVELPKDWWNMELTPQQWGLLTPTQRREKKNNDLRKQMGV